MSTKNTNFDVNNDLTKVYIVHYLLTRLYGVEFTCEMNNNLTTTTNDDELSLRPVSQDTRQGSVPQTNQTHLE